MTAPAPLRRAAFHVVAWSAAGATVAVSVVWGRRLQQDRPEIFLGAAPLVGRDPLDGWDWRFGWGLVAAALVIAALVAAVATGWWWRQSLRVVLGVTALGAGAFAAFLAATDGRDGLLRGADHETEYLANLDIAPPPLEFVRDFLDDIGRYSVHVRGHPPGFVVLLQVMDAIGLDGPWPVVALSLLGTMATPLAVLVAVRSVAGDRTARLAAPFLVVSPYALWMMTSADAVFTALGAWSVATLVLGLRSQRWRGAGWGAVSGVLLGTLLFMTYGGATFALSLFVPIGVALARRASGVWPTVIAGTLTVGVIAATFALLGFWWLDGARETQRQYWAGTAQFRPFGYFAIANLSAALIAIGPVAFAGLLRWRTHGDDTRPTWIATWPLIAGGLLALLASHASQYTRAEVERIWLLFYPWLVVAAANLATVRARRDVTIGGLVAVQGACAVALQAVLVSKW
jgi:methylthioxylose transferase